MRKLLILLIPAAVAVGWGLTTPPAPSPAPAAASSSPPPSLLPPVTVTPTESSSTAGSTSATPEATQSASASPAPRSSAGRLTAEQTAIVWLRATKQVDTSRPYPGLDLSTASELASGPAAAELDLLRKEWASPRTADTTAWKQLLEQRYSSQLTILSSTTATAGDSVSITYRLDETRNGHTTHATATAVTVQLDQGTDHTWRVTRELSNPQAP